MLLPHEIVCMPAAVVPMKVRFLYPVISALVMAQLVNVLGVHVVSNPTLVDTSGGISIDKDLNP
jgi:hypothetical protein